ncbi:hypothetical protein AB4Z29_14970 [Paenibacillus sp. 2TAB23]|uniref:hypothetical protein n=1 Tax=Paenibacillus sp. 2TAB23 TaxID=3233004 RepID=UPI003F9B7620
MTYTLHTQVGRSSIAFQIQTTILYDELTARFRSFEASGNLEASDIQVEVYDFYGKPFDDGPVEIQENGDEYIYVRADYKLVTTPDYSQAKIYVHDDLALKHALINLYSAWLIHRRAGLLIHSSCVVEDERAWMFAGPSGAGKSTVADLSVPRPILSDEATLLLFEPDGSITIHDSPFRSEMEEACELPSSPLAGIHFLIQSQDVRRVGIRKGDALISLLDKVFYWEHNKLETAKMIALCKQAVEGVPAYELYFQKNDTFWGVIS